MSTEKFVSAISTLSAFDKLENVRPHNDLGDCLADVYRELPTPSQDTILAFESALQTSPYIVPVPHVQDTHPIDVLAMATEMNLAEDGIPQSAVHLPSPDTLLAEGVRQLQTGLGDAPVLQHAILEAPRTFTPLVDTSAMAPSWMEAVPKAELDAFQRGVKNLNIFLNSVPSDILSQKDLLQLQFAMGEISAYKEMGVQISQKSASNIETVLKQQE